MTTADALLANFAGVLAAMSALWLASLLLRDASIVDIFWGVGFAGIACGSFALGPADGAGRSILVVAMTCLWGLRLAGHLFARNAGHGEDPRYAAMRRHWGARFPWVSWFTVFALQAVVMWVVSLPVQLAVLSPGPPLGVLEGIGVAVWLVGFVFEAVGDAQLKAFKADAENAGRVMDRGLWRYTRHPNYFGDFCVWWGIFFVALSTPLGTASIIGPILMSFLLLRVSGVPLLERGMAERRPGYARYVETTSSFFPRPPTGGSR